MHCLQPVWDLQQWSYHSWHTWTLCLALEPHEGLAVVDHIRLGGLKHITVSDFLCCHICQTCQSLKSSFQEWTTKDLHVAKFLGLKPSNVWFWVHWTSMGPTRWCLAQPHSHLQCNTPSSFYWSGTPPSSLYPSKYRKIHRKEATLVRCVDLRFTSTQHLMSFAFINSIS